MSQTEEPRFLLETCGQSQEFGAFVVAAQFDRTGALAAFALGDGTLRLVDPTDPSEWRSVAVHDGAALALAPDSLPGGFLSGGDDGLFRRVGGDGSVATLDSFRMKWVEHVASHAGDKPVLACSVGKLVHVFDGSGAKLKTLEHPSAVTGLAFDAKGKRVAASHYNGATLWFVAAKTDSPRRLEWKGSHIGVALHPAGDAVVTAMQENALHGWRLADGQHMRMSGYPSKTESLSFTKGGKWMASSGADAIVLWPFFGGGAVYPRRRPPGQRHGRRRLRRRAGGAGGYRILAYPAGGAPRPRPDHRAGLGSHRHRAGGGYRNRLRRHHRLRQALTLFRLQALSRMRGRAGRGRLCAAQ
jgi:WD40 repeat protein